VGFGSPRGFLFPYGCNLSEQILTDLYADSIVDQLAISSRFATILTKRVSVVFGLWGEAGIGKTFTARQVLHQTACQHLSAHASVPILELVRGLPLVKNLPVWAERLEDRVRQGEYLEDETVLDLLAAKLSALAPFALYLEDLHETGLEQRELIVQLARRAGRIKGVGLLVSSRQLPPEPFEAHRLEPLDRNTVRVMLEAEVASSLPVAALDWIHARAAGNPLFTLEFFRHMARQGVIWSDGQRWHWRTPDRESTPATVGMLIEQQLLVLARDEEAQRALETKTLIEVRAPKTPLASETWTKASQLSHTELEQARQVLERGGVLIGDAFAHPLYREIGFAQISPTKRSQIARRVLEAIDDARLRAQFLDDADLGSEATKTMLLKAAQAARGAGAELQAGRFLARAVPLHAGEAQAGVALEAAQQLRYLDVNEAERLAVLAGESDAHRFEATWLRAELLAEQSRGLEAERLVETLPEAQHKDLNWWVGILRLRGLTNSVTGTLEVLNAHPGVLEHCDAKTLNRAVRVLANTGEFSQIEALVQRGLERATNSEERILHLKSAALIALERADFAQSERLEAEILGLARKIGNLRWVDAALFNRALALEGLGRQQERLEMLEEAMRVCIEMGDITALAIAQVSFAGALHSFAEYERAEQVLLEAQAVFVTLDPTGHAIDCESGLVALYLDWPQQYAPMLALKYARSAQDLARSLNTPRYHLEVACLIARALNANNQPLEALEHSEKAVRLAESLDLPTSKFDALWTHGLMLWANAQSAQALGFLNRAQQAAEAYDDHGAAQRVGLDIDRLTNNLEAAKDRLAWFEQRQLHHFCNLTRRYFSSLSQPSNTQPAPATLEKSSTQLEVLGQMRLRQADHLEPIRGRKRQEFLALLLEARIAGRHEIPKLELIDRFYRDSTEAQAAASLKDLAHQIRTTYGPELIVTTTHGYALGAVQSDLEAYLETGDAQHWNGPYLSGPEDGLRPSLQHHLLEQAERSLEHQPEEALRLGRILLEQEPFDLAAVRLIARAMNTCQPRQLEAFYRAQRKRWLELGETLPEDTQEFLIGNF
jgi:tetratricopeptide (TPR) repeat protein